jgi:hypothetical protein
MSLLGGMWERLSSRDQMRNDKWHIAAGKPLPQSIHFLRKQSLGFRLTPVSFCGVTKHDSFFPYRVF